MIDLHCHLLPYVDDGAHDLEEAKALLAMEAEQGVTQICLTPHLRQDMFEIPDEMLQRQFERLLPTAEAMGLKLLLSREYHYDRLFLEYLQEGRVLPIGGSVLLTEFSSAHSGEDILSAVKRIKSFGYRPLIAHAERYPATDPALLSELRSEGAMIQLNADAVLGQDGRYLKRLTWTLLKDGLVDVIGSDAHSRDDRPPRLSECRQRLAKKLGEEQAERLLASDPLRIIQGKEH